MKKTLKALALTLALLTTTACGKEEAKVEEVTLAQATTTVAKEAKLDNIETPKAEAVEVKEKENQTLLIPQTVELKDSQKEEATAEELVEETTELAANNEKFAANNIDSVSRTSESTTLANTVEENVAAVATEVEEANQVEEILTVEEIEVVNQAPAAEATLAGGLTVASPSAEAVKSYWKNYTSAAANTADFMGINLVNQEDIHEQAPNADLNNLNQGKVSAAAQADALHIANTVRYATGLNEMTLGADQAAYAQAATMVNRLNLQVSHNPAAPAGLDTNTYNAGAYGAANSNLAASFGLLDSVVEYLKDDLGENNQQEAGHRRWILNPSATAVGFGQTEEFNAMYVNNNDYAGQNADQVVAYPGETAISEFHSEASSLSIQFGENFDITNAQVTVTDLQTGEVRTDAHIDQSFKGNGRAITFGNGMNYAPGTRLQVKVEGVTRNGGAYPVEYTVNYMSIR